MAENRKNQNTSFCKKFHIRKRACESSCDFVCKLNKTGGTKDMHALSVIAQEFHVTKNQLRCAVRDSIIHPEIIQRKKNTIVLLEKSEVAKQLTTIVSYPKKSDAEKEMSRNYHRQIALKITKNNMTQENLNDLCTLEQASKEFGINFYRIRIALNFGVLHSHKRDNHTKYMVSRAEIQKNLEVIKKSNRLFYRILLKKQQQPQESHEIPEHIKPEIHENNVDLQDFKSEL